MRSISIFGIIALWTQALLAQQFQFVDSLHFPEDQDIHHMLVKLEIPMGELYMKASDCDGTSISRLSSPDSLAQHIVETNEGPSGNYICNIKLAPPAAPTAGARMAPANMRLSDQLTTIDTYSEAKPYRSSFCPDPSIDTDLFIDLGVGGSRLDLSGLSLNNVSINSAFSDVTVHYRQPNQIEMTQMDIHAASANVVLKNLEMAKARMVTVQNDMGDTKLILGKGYIPGGEITVRAGVGGLILIVDENQPIELRLKTGFFSSVDMPDEFKKIKNGTYINTAMQSNPDARVIITCEVDFGSVSVITN